MAKVKNHLNIFLVFLTARFHFDGFVSKVSELILSGF